MQNEQPLNIAILEEILIFLAFVGISTILWAVTNDGTDFWREVPKATMYGYLIRVVAEGITRYRGKPLLRLMPDNRVK